MRKAPEVEATDTALAGSETTRSCANCDGPLAAEHRFCAYCGQRAGHARLTMRDISRDFLHALTHADHSVFALVKALSWRPGHVAREYIGGKRKKAKGPAAKPGKQEKKKAPKKRGWGDEDDFSW